MAAKGKKTNPETIMLINGLREASRESGARIWRDISDRLSRPKRTWAEVNVGKIEKIIDDGERVVIPGRLLGSGSISKKVIIGSVSWTKGAKEKVEKAGGKVMSLLEMASHYPSGSGIRIIK